MPINAFKYKGLTKEQVFKDYEAFVQKFNTTREKTTDECITPPDVYYEVVRWVSEHVELEGREIVRPFYPGGDFTTFEYPERCVVVDNPPFSIRSKICKFYLERGIDFLLFSPAVSVFTKIDVTFILTASDIIFDNGAVIPVSFVTTLFPDVRVMTAPDLKEALERCYDDARKARSKDKRKCFKWPSSVLSSVRDPFYEVEVSIKKTECQYEANPCGCKNVYGGSFLLSDKATQRVEAAREAREAREAAREAREEIHLCDNDRAIIERLNAIEDNPA